MTDRETLAADLEAVANILRTKGRCVGALESSEGKMCLEGAIYDHLNGIKSARQMPPRYSSPDNPDSHLDTDAVYQFLISDDRAQRITAALADHVPEERSTAKSTKKAAPLHDGEKMVDILYQFNDHGDTTDQDVFDLIDKTIANL